MHRFFVSRSDISSGKIVITDDDQSHHIKDVLRLKAGSKVTVCDDEGNEYLCEVEKLSPRVSLLVKETRACERSHKRVSLTVACAIPKKSNIDDIIDKLTQLGVDRIIPLRTDRVIVDIAEKKADSRLARWRKIALNASEQSKRISLPRVDPLTDFGSLVKGSDEFDLKLIPVLFGERKDLVSALPRSRPLRVLVLIGPEGDFSQEEAGLALAKGFIPVSLGQQVLRVETAAVAVASFIMLYEND